MASDLPDRFWLVVDANTRTVIGDATSARDAADAARAYVKSNIGAVAAVMAVEDAYSSRATVDKEFLQYPTIAPEAGI